MLEHFQSFHFLRPSLLWLAVLAIGVWWIWRKHADPLRGWRAQVDADLLDALIDQSDSKPRSLLPLLVAWLVAVLAIAGPSWKPEPSPFAEDATPLIVLLKADTSMDTPDPEPSRLERAHLKIADLSQARKGQPLALIAYAGSAHLVLPPTKDTSAVATMAAEISPGIMPVPGDRLDLAIARAAELLKDSGGTLLIMTDMGSSGTAEITTAYEAADSPDIQILAIAPVSADTSQLDSLAKSIDARLVPMTDDNTDIQSIVERAARAPVARGADGRVRWQDGGYYLVPLLVVLALLPFRRESQTQETV
ncbi:VWA domain-containing protein [Haloferula chungangensis]|uniref:VWA domain-containing protein n=1 Tax=Haloferula chungangensis TaxID=1048331 RepID=A0ABW2LBM9_9BACT